MSLGGNPSRGGRVRKGHSERIKVDPSGRTIGILRSGKPRCKGLQEGGTCSVNTPAVGRKPVGLWKENGSRKQVRLEAIPQTAKRNGFQFSLEK